MIKSGKILDNKIKEYHNQEKDSATKRISLAENTQYIHQWNKS
jgi:hypothetical protein